MSEKYDLKRFIQHYVSWTLNDIASRTKSIEEFLDKNNNVALVDSAVENKFRTLLVENYSALMQRYAVCLEPLFDYIETEMPFIKEQVAPLRTLYATILSRGNFKDGCKCPGCKTEVVKEESVQEIIKKDDAKRLERNRKQREYRDRKKKEKSEKDN